MFMQHAVKSEFSDVKKITQTVRFDTEEALGSDATDVAIAFKIDSTDQTGANLSVFTTPKQAFSAILTALQANNLDPVSIEPDANCLARFICQKFAGEPDAHPLFAFLSGHNGYFIAPLTLPWYKINPMPPAAMRAFLIHSPRTRTELLARQASMTTALLKTGQPINRLEIFDVANSVNIAEIGGRLNLQSEQIDMLKSAGFTAEITAGCPDAVEFAIAFGAALACTDPPGSASWRSDFMPYQGRKMRLQNTMKYFCVALTLLMLALGLYGFMQGLQFKKYRSGLREKFSEEFSKVMLGEKFQPKWRSSEAVRRIGRPLTASRKHKEEECLWPATTSSPQNCP